MSRPSPGEQRELNKLARIQQAREAEPLELAIREEGTGDPPPAIVRPKRLRVVESDGTVREILLDPYFGGYVTVEHERPRVDQPWVTEAVIERFPVFGITSVTLEDA